MHLSKLRIVTVDVNNDTLEGREVLQAEVEITKLIHGVPHMEVQMKGLELWHGSWCELHLHGTTPNSEPC